jgi:cytochrome c
MNKLLGMAAVLLSLHAGTAFAQQAQTPDLKTLPQSRQVRSVSYCKGVYAVTFRDGNSFKLPEYNLRFKTDGGTLGPLKQSPVMVPSGMSGDRATLVFSSPGEISSFIKLEC